MEPLLLAFIAIIYLPLTGYTVHLPLIVQKFFYDNMGCRRKIFIERFFSFPAPYARRLLRLQEHLSNKYNLKNARPILMNNSSLYLNILQYNKD